MEEIQAPDFQAADFPTTGKVAIRLSRELRQVPARANGSSGRGEWTSAFVGGVARTVVRACRAGLKASELLQLDPLRFETDPLAFWPSCGKEDGLPPEERLYEFSVCLAVAPPGAGVVSEGRFPQDKEVAL